MATHATLTGADLHEPKGAASAAFGDVYQADGTGSGTWVARLPNMSGKAGQVLTTDGTSEAWTSVCLTALGHLTSLSTVPVVNSGHNIASVSRTSTGVYVVTFSTPMVHVNYVVHAMATYTGGSAVTVYELPTTRTINGFSLEVYVQGTGVADPSALDLLVYGGI